MNFWKIPFIFIVSFVILFEFIRNYPCNIWIGFQFKRKKIQVPQLPYKHSNIPPFSDIYVDIWNRIGHLYHLNFQLISDLNSWKKVLVCDYTSQPAFNISEGLKAISLAPVRNIHSFKVLSIRNHFVALLWCMS